MGKYSFDCNISYVNEAIICAKRASAYFDEYDSKLISLKNGLDCINCSLYSTNFDEIMGVIGNVRNIECDIEKSRNLALEGMISLGTFEDNVVEWIKKDEISASDFLDFAEYYMRNLYEEDPYYAQKMTKVSSIGQLFKRKDIPEEFIEDINVALATKIIESNQMYTREGVVSEAYTICGLFAIFGSTLNYKLGESFDRYDQGLYFGTKGANMGMLDCCNLNDWLFRGVGIDVYQGGADTMYMYGIDIPEYLNKTPQNEYYADKNSEYFKNARPGDIMLNGGHTRVILEKTDTGYVTVEEGGGRLQISHYTFEELGRTLGKSNAYVICNMDAIYRNTSSTNPGISLKYVQPQHKDSLREDQQIRGGGVFFHPAEWVKQLNISNDAANKMLIQYNLRNENPNVGIPKSSDDKVIEAVTLGNENYEFNVDLFKKIDENQNM